MQRLATAAVLIIAAALFFNHGFIVSPPLRADAVPDHIGLMIGYNKVREPIDLIKTFWGPWLCEHPVAVAAGGAYRPLSSFLWYGLIAIGQGVGWGMVNWITFATFAVNCLLVAALAYQFTRSYWLSVASGVLFSNILYWCPLLPSQARDGYHWLQWWALNDQLLTISLCLSSLLMFARWQEQGDRKYLAWSWVLFVAGCFTKEYCYGLPAMIFGLALMPSTPGRRATLKHSVLMGMTSVAFFIYRAAILGPDAYGNERNRGWAVEESVRNWMPPSPMDIFVMPLIPMLFWVTTYAAIIGGAVYLWQHRGAVREVMHRPAVSAAAWRAAVLWLCVQASYIPILGFPYLSHSGMPSAAIRCVFAASALHLAWVTVRAVRLSAVSRKSNTASIRTLILRGATQR